MRRVAGMAVVLLAVAVCGAAPAGAKVYTRMFDYYQGFSSTDPYNPIHYPKSMRVLGRELASPKFPQYAREYQAPPRRHTSWRPSAAVSPPTG